MVLYLNLCKVISENIYTTVLSAELHIPWAPCRIIVPYSVVFVRLRNLSACHLALAQSSSVSAIETYQCMYTIFDCKSAIFSRLLNVLYRCGLFLKTKIEVRSYSI